MTSAYHLQSNGLTEWFNQTLQRILLNSEQNNWMNSLMDLYLPRYLQNLPFEIICRCSYVSMHRMHNSCFYVITCRKAVLPVEVGGQSQIDSGYSSKDCNTSYYDCDIIFSQIVVTLNK